MPLVLSGSVDISGSMTATTILVSSPGGGGMVSSSQQIQNYNLFAVTSSANTFYGNQSIIGGNLGVGTTTPLVASGYTTISVNNVTNGGIIDLQQSGTSVARFGNNGTSVAFLETRTATPITISTNDTQRIHVTSGGTTQVTGSVFVANATGTNVTPQLTVTNTSTNGYGIVRLVGNARGGVIDFYNTSSAQASIAANDGTLQIYTGGDSSGSPKVTINSSGNLESSGTFSFKSAFSSYNTDGLFNANSRPSAIVSPGGSQNIKFGYNDYGGGQYYGRIGFPATTNWSLGIIDSAGNNFSIGTDYRGVQLYIYSNGNYAFSGSNVSDSRKKANINYIISSQLDTILKLKPACFNQKNQEGNINSNTHTGFIAQDVLEAGIANIVHGSDEEGYGLDYYGVLALSIKAMQEQQAIIDGLIARIEALESK
jgi:hypothetical protein